MKKQQISRFHLFIKKLKHALAGHYIEEKNTKKEHRDKQKYIKILEKAKDVFFYMFTISFLLFFISLISGIKIFSLYNIPLFLFFFSLLTFFFFLIIKFKLDKFKLYLKIREEDKNINLN
ncbi:MAG: hypothetical protein ACYDDB_03490 [bacterium]